MFPSFPKPTVDVAQAEEPPVPPELSAFPHELFVHNIFPHLSAWEIFQLGSTNKMFKQLAHDDTYWRQKLQEDYNFPVNSTARMTGWLFLYKKVRNAQLYVWGCNSKGRMGDPHLRGVTSPTRLAIPGAHIVSLVAGGWSFTAIDSKGDIYIWGTLHGEYMGEREGDDFGDPRCTARRPMRLQLPVKYHAISCGRMHVTAMGQDASVWTFTSWGRPFRLASPYINKTSLETTPVQVESGWNFSAILTASGDVLFYQPLGRGFQTVSGRMEAVRVTPDAENVIPCVPWVLDGEGANLVRLPGIPTTLPNLLRTGLRQGTLSQRTKLVKIAGLSNDIIGLTNKGHVLKFVPNTDSWEYLPLFSDIDEIGREMQRSAGPGTVPVGDLPDAMRITHISGRHKTFFAYSVGARSMVLMGSMGESIVRPTIIPTLQQEHAHNAVVSVVVGDYHYGALTASGRLLTWGAYSDGALGLGPGVGRNPDVKVPTEVRFGADADVEEDGRRRMFCFGATASGWHTGALVIDLDEVEQDDDVEHVDADA